ncbi:hypothetical protein IFM89_002252 [Coptis chinensis]|uniref:TNase-like domain-containing protein n=1 Tax=Coptis chinensis TaxID=261450 RepID=A0A835ILQ0_9MAGN|nr:hypothetical protein IFM89_002252 [Coptis chinensis]
MKSSAVSSKSYLLVHHLSFLRQQSISRTASESFEIRSPKMGNPRRDEKLAPYAREAREFLRTCLIGRQPNTKWKHSLSRWFLVALGPPSGTDFEERSNYYDALLAAESRSTAGKKGIHSAKDPPIMHITDLLTASSKKTKDFLPFLQRGRRLPAIVEYVLSGHRFKLLIPKETCTVTFSFSGVRFPGRGEPYSDEAIAFMRSKILQRDVEVEVETVDRTRTYLGSMWDPKTNVAVTLLEAGLAKLQTAFGANRIADAHLLALAEQSAKRKKLKVLKRYLNCLH